MPRAGTLTKEDAPTARLDERLGDVRKRVEASGFDTAVVVNEARIVLGLLRSQHLEKDPDVKVEEAMSAGPSTFRPHVFITEMAEFMDRHDLPSVPVTTGEGKLVGLLLKEDAMRAARELHEAGHQHGA